jgi:phosphatidate cytidylyltransferase
MIQRTITGIVFGAVMLGGVFGGMYTFFGLFTLVTAGCLWEFTGLVFKNDPSDRLRRLAGTGWGVLVYLLIGGSGLGLLDGAFSFYGLILAVLTAPVFLALELFLHPEKPFERAGYYLTGLLYISLPFSLLTYLSMPAGEFFSTGDYDPLRVFGLLLLIWSNDSWAYIFGSRFGRHKLYERISPGKTWEGFIGGGIFALLTAWGLSFLIPSFTPAQWLKLAAAAVIFGTIGDLVESMLKRSLQIKDSGTLLPGHGGLLDRFDAFVFAIPFYWLVLVI